MKRIARNLFPVAEYLHVTGKSSVLYGLAIVRNYDPELIAKLAFILRQDCSTLNLLVRPHPRDFQCPSLQWNVSSKRLSQSAIPSRFQIKCSMPELVTVSLWADVIECRWSGC